LSAIRTPQTSSREGDLAAATPGRAERALALGLSLLSLVTFALAAPFSRYPLPRIEAFVPAYESTLSISDLIAAVILFAHFGRNKSVAVLILACAYLFNALIAVPHMLSFPGVFSATGLLAARPQTTSWLYVFWHAGFALYALAFAGLRRTAPALRVRDARRSLWAAFLANAIGVGALTLLATAGR